MNTPTQDILELVDVTNASQSRRIFWDRDIYERELTHVFGRCWQFLTHETLIPKSGDFVVTKMGQDEVIVLRQADASIRVFLNSCTHRGNKLCHAEGGNTRGLACGYHGWAFGIDGSLKGVPCEEAYGPDFDRSRRSLHAIARVESFHGFVFGCMDPGAPSLCDYLGDMAWYLETWMDVAGGIEFLGQPSRSVLRTNWKIPAENFIGDVYHVNWTHASAFKVIADRAAAAGFDMSKAAPSMGPEAGIMATTRHGHGLGVLYEVGPALMAETCPELFAWQGRRIAELTAKYGPERARLFGGHWDATIFPNCSFVMGAVNAFKQWIPRGPDSIEVLTWAFAEQSLPEDLKQRIATASHRLFGTAGLFEADDGDAMEYCAQQNQGRATRETRVDSNMGRGTEREDPVFPGVVGNYMNELAQRGFYRFYAECMSSSGWDAMRANDPRWKRAHLGR